MKLTPEQISERFHALSADLVAGEVEPQVVVLYSLTHALSVARAALTEEEMEEVMALAFALNVNAVIEEQQQKEMS